MGANIELWRYRFFENSSLYLEEALAGIELTPGAADSAKDLVMVAAGKKAARTRATASYTIDERFAGKPANIVELAHKIRDFIIRLDASIEEAPKKLYIAYKTSQNIVCMVIKEHQILLYLKLNPKELVNTSAKIRDVTGIGHYGTGKTEVTIKSEADLQLAKPLIEMAYRQVGG
jgi:predicted transport protein